VCALRPRHAHFPDARRFRSDSRITERPFAPNDTGMGDIPVNDNTMAMLQTSLDESFAGTGVQGPRIVNDGGSCPQGVSTPPASRSEEHTSELQSREKLVCSL